MIINSKMLRPVAACALAAVVCVNAFGDVVIPAEKIRYDRNKPSNQSITLSDEFCEKLPDEALDATFYIVPRKFERKDLDEKMKADSVQRFIKMGRLEKVYLDQYTDLSKSIGKTCKPELKDFLNAFYAAAKPSYSTKDQADIEKDLAKGKVPKKLGVYIKKEAEYRQNHGEQSQQIYQYAEKYPDEFVKMCDWKGVFKTPVETYWDTIPNPCASRRKENLLKGWEWLSAESPEEVVERYPHSITYWKYESHPQYRVFRENWYSTVYDAKGNLVYVSNIVEALPIGGGALHESPVAKFYAVQAYKNNEYDIKSRPKAVNHYIKTKIGLEDLTPQEKAEREKAMDAYTQAAFGAARAEQERNPYRRKQMSDKSGLQALGALIALSSREGSDEGDKWLDQVMIDFRKELRRNAEGELCDDYVDCGRKRVDNTPLVQYFGFENGKPKYQVTYTYFGTKPFEYDVKMKADFYKPLAEEKKEDAYYKVDKPVRYTTPAVNRFDADGGPNKIVITEEVIDAVSNKMKIVEQVIGSNDFDEGASETSADNSDSPALDIAQVDQRPEFPGGNNAMYKWIGNNLKYPEQARKDGIQGKVIVEFEILENGSIGKCSILRGREKSLDFEALRLIKAMPAWTPGMNKGKPVKTKYSIPITFRL